MLPQGILEKLTKVKADMVKMKAEMAEREARIAKLELTVAEHKRKIRLLQPTPNLTESVLQYWDDAIHQAVQQQMSRSTTKKPRPGPLKAYETNQGSK